MTFLCSILKIVLFTFSFLGYILFINRKLKVRGEMAPLLFIGGVSILSLISGIFNMLIYTNILILLTGLVFFYTMLKDILRSNTKKQLLQMLINPNLIIIAVIFIYFIIISSRLHIIHYDNFTHWALVVQDMLELNQLPNFESLITFRSYPLGSALFIYYCCFWLSSAENVMIIAQSIILVSSLCTLFAFVPKKRSGWIYRLLIISFILLCSVFCMSFKELLVDTILATVGIGAISVIIYYYKDLKKISFLSAVLSTFLVMIKNSGIYFFVINTLVVLYRAYKGIKNQEFTKKQALKTIAISIVLPFFIMVIWKAHLPYAFGKNASMGFHNMSILRYGGQMLRLDIDTLMKILKLFFSEIINIRGRILQSILVINIVYGIYLLSTYFSNRKWNKSIIFSWLISDVIYVAYLLGTLAMYIFSMPVNEALYLAGYDRYLSTIIMYLFGILVICLLKNDVQASGRKVINSIVAGVLIAVFSLNIYTSDTKLNILGIDAYDTSIKATMDKIKAQYDFYPEKTYAVCIVGEDTLDSGYIRFMAKYTFRTNNITIVKQLKEETKEYLKTCDYVIILSGREAIEKIIAKREEKPVIIDAEMIK